MQVLKQHKIIALISLLIVITLAISAALVFVQNIPGPSSNPSSSATPSPSPAPTETSETSSTPSATKNATAIPTSHSMPTAFLFPDEVSQYQGQNLTPVSAYIEYLNEHPDVAIAGTQNIDKATYKLAITGMVNNSVSYKYNEVINNFNSSLQVATLPCVEGWSVTLLWQGVQITDLLQQTGLSPDATTLIFLASDGYSTSLPLDYVRQNNITIAYKMNNVTLTAQTGWPFFLVAKNQYGYKWIEWLTEINVSNDSNYLGYWESRGYPNDATVIGANENVPPSNTGPVVLLVATVSVATVTVAMAVFKLKKKHIF